MPARRSDGTPSATPQAELLTWYARVARDFPWRATRDPYQILVSEVMLQQTQAARVVPFYARFIERFPDERALAVADDETIHRLWKGLGYPNRVERLRACARAVVARGSWPDSPEALEELPGIGPYTAHSVSCFAFGKAVPVVDTNVARVYARRDGLALPLDKKQIWIHAASQVEPSQPIAYTNALMDLGATVCTARAPHCEACPWLRRCASRGNAPTIAATSNPLKVAAKKVVYGHQLDARTGTERALPRLHIVLGLIHHDGRYLVARRKSDAHVGGFWELPGGKREDGEDDRATLARELGEELGAELLAARSILNFHHLYPDRALTFHVYRCRLFNPESVRALASQEVRWVTPAEFVALPFPPANQAVIERMRKYHRWVGEIRSPIRQV